MSSDLHAQIAQAAARNRELLDILAATDNAVPDLAQQRRFVAELEQQIKKSDTEVKKLDTRRQKELKEHEKYRDSVMRRFAHKAVGKKDKFAEKAEREEREYFDALQDETREKELNANLRAQLAEAQRACVAIEAEAKRHEDAQTALDQLYNAIFAGPTPSYPTEDNLEKDVERALWEYQDTRSKAEAEQHAYRLLTQAKKQMAIALSQMEEALSASRMDMFGGGTFSDMMERNALQRADKATDEARILVLQAQRMTPHIGDLPSVKISHGNLMGDVFFDNIFTDMAFHDKIKESRESVRRSDAALTQERDATKARHAELTSQLQGREETLQRTRKALQQERGRVFEQVAGSKQ